MENRKRCRDKDNRSGGYSTWQDGRSSPGGCSSTPGTHTKNKHNKKHTHAWMQTPNPPQVRSWHRQSGGRATEDKHTHTHTTMYDPRANRVLSPLSSRSSFPRCIRLPFLRSAVKTAASARSVFYSCASSFHDLKRKKTERGNEPLRNCFEWNGDISSPHEEK